MDLKSKHIPEEARKENPEAQLCVELPGNFNETVPTGTYPQTPYRLVQILTFLTLYRARSFHEVSAYGYFEIPAF